MPELSRFYGIVIRMYFADHPPPHFHAYYAGEEAVVGIENQLVVAGSLPARALALVAEWASLHRAELREAWNLAVVGKTPGKIEPLA